MIDKKQFIELMTEYKKVLESESKVNEAMKLLDEDFGYFSIRNSTFLFEKALSLAMDDIGDWIPYFVYDCEWGERDMGVVVRGRKFKLDSLSQLYKLITNEKGKK